MVFDIIANYTYILNMSFGERTSPQGAEEAERSLVLQAFHRLVPESPIPLQELPDKQGMKLFFTKFAVQYPTLDDQQQSDYLLLLKSFFYTTAHRVCRQNGLPPDTAEVILQEALIETDAALKKGQYQVMTDANGKIIPFTAYAARFLYTTATDIGRAERRKAGNDKELIDEADSVSEQEFDPTFELTQRIIDLLPPREQQLVKLRMAGIVGTELYDRLGLWGTLAGKKALLSRLMARTRKSILQLDLADQLSHTTKTDHIPMIEPPEAPVHLYQREAKIIFPNARGGLQNGDAMAVREIAGFLMRSQLKFSVDEALIIQQYLFEGNVEITGISQEAAQQRLSDHLTSITLKIIPLLSQLADPNHRRMLITALGNKKGMATIHVETGGGHSVVWAPDDDLIYLEIPTDCSQVQINCVTPEQSTKGRYGRRTAQGLHLLIQSGGSTSLYRLQQLLGSKKSSLAPDIFDEITERYRRVRPGGNLILRESIGLHTILRLGHLSEKSALDNWWEYVSDVMNNLSVGMIAQRAGKLMYEFAQREALDQFGIPFGVLRLRQPGKPDEPHRFAAIRSAQEARTLEFPLLHDGIAQARPWHSHVGSTQTLKSLISHLQSHLQPTIKQNYVMAAEYFPDTYILHGLDEASELTKRVGKIYRESSAIQGAVRSVELDGIRYSTISADMRQRNGLPAHIIAHIPGETTPRVLPVGELYEPLVDHILHYGGFVPYELAPLTSHTGDDIKGFRSQNQVRLNSLADKAWQRPFIEPVKGLGFRLAEMDESTALSSYVLGRADELQFASAKSPLLYSDNNLEIISYENFTEEFYTSGLVPVIIRARNKPLKGHLILDARYSYLRELITNGRLDMSAYELAGVSYNTVFGQLYRLMQNIFSDFESSPITVKNKVAYFNG